MITIPRTGAAYASLIAGGLILLAAASTGLKGCAHVQAPPGGPPDSIPPTLIAVYPDSYAVVSWVGTGENVRFEFDESISEQNVQLAAMLYPFEPRPKIDKGKRELRVRPKAGWVPDRIYHVRIEPVVQDLFNNRIEQPIYHILSTGPPIPENAVRGTVHDRITGRPLANGRVDMVTLPDTLRYGGVADSAGGFSLEMLPAGEYYAIGYEDLNSNMRADAFDRSDTIQATLGSEELLELNFQVFRHDTVGPKLIDVSPVDTLVLALGFDGYLDPEAPLGTAAVQVISLPDSALIALDTVLHAWRYEAWRDSVAETRRAALAAADTAGAEEPPVEIEPAARPGPPPPAERLDSLTQEPLQPAALPDRRIYVVAAAAIPPGPYLVRAYRLLNLTGLQADSEASFEQPEPPEPPAPPPDESPEEPPDEPPPDTASAARRGGVG